MWDGTAGILTPQDGNDNPIVKLLPPVVTGTGNAHLPLGMGMGREAGVCFNHVAVWESNMTPTGLDGTSVLYVGGGNQWINVGASTGARQETTTNGVQRETMMGNTWNCSTEHGRYTPFLIDHLV